VCRNSPQKAKIILRREKFLLDGNQLWTRRVGIHIITAQKLRNQDGRFPKQGVQLRRRPTTRKKRGLNFRQLMGWWMPMPILQTQEANGSPNRARNRRKVLLHQTASLTLESKHVIDGVRRRAMT
jgi:hypothetical protein